MKLSTVKDFILCCLLVVGLFGAASVSYRNFTGTPCPHLLMIPICYVVFAAYGLMTISIVVPHLGFKHVFFCVGWGTAFVVALAGSVAELVAGGGVCPTTGGSSIRAASSGSVPLCFASLAMLIVILILFLTGPYKRACNSGHPPAAA